MFDYPTVSALCQFIGTLATHHPGKVLGLHRCIKCNFETHSDPTPSSAYQAFSASSEGAVCAFAGVGAVARPTSALVRDDIVPVIHALVSSIAGADLAADMPLSQAGLDSLASVELRNDLSRYHDLRRCLHPLSSDFCSRVTRGQLDLPSMSEVPAEVMHIVQSSSDQELKPAYVGQGLLSGAGQHCSLRLPHHQCSGGAHHGAQGKVTTADHNTRCSLPFQRISAHGKVRTTREDCVLCRTGTLRALSACCGQHEKHAI